MCRFVYVHVAELMVAHVSVLTFKFSSDVFIKSKTFISYMKGIEFKLMFNYLISVEFEHISNISSTAEIQLVFSYWIMKWTTTVKN